MIRYLIQQTISPVSHLPHPEHKSLLQEILKLKPITMMENRGDCLEVDFNPVGAQAQLSNEKGVTLVVRRQPTGKYRIWRRYVKNGLVVTA